MLRNMTSETIYNAEDVRSSVASEIERIGGYARVWGGRTCPAALIIVGAPFSSENYRFLAALAYLS